MGAATLAAPSNVTVTGGLSVEDMADWPTAGGGDDGGLGGLGCDFGCLSWPFFSISSLGAAWWQRGTQKAFGSKGQTLSVHRPKTRETAAAGMMVMMIVMTMMMKRWVLFFCKQIVWRSKQYPA